MQKENSIIKSVFERCKDISEGSQLFFFARNHSHHHLSGGRSEDFFAQTEEESNKVAAIKQEVSQVRDWTTSSMTLSKLLVSLCSMRFGEA